MAWLNQRNAFSEKDLDLYDLKPGEKCNIHAITWSRAENVSMKASLSLLNNNDQLTIFPYLFRTKQALQLSLSRRKKRINAG